MTTDVQASAILTPLSGGARPLSEWTTTFHLGLVVLDPYALESSWIIDTAARILRDFSPADVRVAFLVTASIDEVRTYMGPLVDEFLVFADQGGSAARALGLSSLPAFVHVDQACRVTASAEGWDPAAWSEVAADLAARLDWSVPEIPAAGDPTPFAGRAFS